jgi:hypothetical protein
MIKKIHLVLFFICAHSFVQASFPEKLRSFGTEVGKKIMQNPLASIAIGALVMNVLPFYYRRKTDQLIREEKAVWLNQGLTQAEKQKESAKLVKQQRTYVGKFKSFSDKVFWGNLIATPAALMAFVMQGKDENAQINRLIGVSLLAIILRTAFGGPFSL